MQRIKTDLKSANLALLDQQLKAVFPTQVNTVIGDRYGLHIEMTDDATPADIAQALAIAAAHNPDDETPAEKQAASERAMITAFLTADKIEVDLVMVSKVLKYILKRMN